MIYHDYTPFETGPERILRVVKDALENIVVTRPIRWTIVRELAHWPVQLLAPADIFFDGLRWEDRMMSVTVEYETGAVTVRAREQAKLVSATWPSLRMAAHHDPVAGMWRFDATSNPERMMLVAKALDVGAKLGTARFSIRTSEIATWPLPADDEEMPF